MGLLGLLGLSASHLLHYTVLVAAYEAFHVDYQIGNLRIVLYVSCDS